ncbi:MAG TPA: hypothetical protein VH439_17185 [Gemmatimonadales bacterium]|jgi:hypothetical protein
MDLQTLIGANLIIAAVTIIPSVIWEGVEAARAARRRRRPA